MKVVSGVASWNLDATASRVRSGWKGPLSDLEKEGPN